MAETSKNKIYYNDNENSVADVLADMKKMAESTDEAIEKSKYNDAAIKKSISDVEKKQVEKNTEQDSKIVELQTEKAKLETELKEMQEDFYQNSIRGQASGEYIHVEDSSNCRAKIGISGNHEQETREGYNLLNFDVKQNSKVTYNKEDGSITINGQGGFILAYSSVKYEANKTYTQIMELVSGTVTEASGENAGNNRSEFIMSQNKKWFYSGSPEKFTSGEDSTGDGFWCNVNAMFNNARIRIWAYEGTEDKPYEQYGVSPSPDYPSSIVAVGSNVNIFDKESVKKDYRLGSTGDLFPDKGYFTSDYIELSINTNYTLSINETGVSTAYVIYDKDKKFISRFLTSNNKTYLITNNTSSKQYIRIASYLTDIDNVKFEEGTVATPHSKFGQGCVKVKVANKNYFKSRDVNGTISGITLSGNEENIKVTGTPTNTWLNTAAIDLGFMPAGKYSISYNRKNTTKGNYKIWIVNEKNKIIFSVFSEFTLTSDYEKVRCMLVLEHLTVGEAFNDTVSVQIERETTTSFEQHKEQSYIMPVQKEMLEEDYFDWDNEEEVHIWNKLVLNTVNTTDFGIAREFSGDYIGIYMRQAKIDTLNIKQGSKLLSNNLKQFEKGTNVEGMFISGTGDYTDKMICIGVKRSRLATEDIAGLNTYFSENPIEIYYQSTVKTRLPFTDEQKAVAKELNNARTYKNVTNITTDSKAILSLDYAKDLETLLNNTQALAVNNASEGV